MKRLSAFLIALLLLCTLPLTALAAGAVDMGKNVSLTICHTYGDVKLEGVTFDLYLISTMDETGELTPTEDFAAYEDMVDIRGKNDAAWYATAEALDQTISASDSIVPADSAVTDQNGIAAFPIPGKTLVKGLYLVRATEVVRDDFIYSTLPFMVLLPARDSITDEWIYDVAVNSKPEQVPVLEDITVVKIWKDYGHTEKRPKSITIQLLRDGEPYGKAITLPHNGEWSYTWVDLEAYYDWSVKELKVDNYTSDVTQEGNTFVVTNTLDEPKLPQTGQMNWPIPVMTVAGLALFIFGWYLCFGRKREGNEK